MTLATVYTVVAVAVLAVFLPQSLNSNSEVAAQNNITERNLTFVCAAQGYMAAPTDPLGRTFAGGQFVYNYNNQTLLTCKRSGNTPEGDPSFTQCPTGFFCQSNWWSWIGKLAPGYGYCCGFIVSFLGIELQGTTFVTIYDNQTMGK